MYNVQLIYGPKGCGKTKKLVDMANDSVKDAKGVLVYIDKDNSRMHDLDHAIKLVDASEYDVRCEKTFPAFVKGLLAGNYDIQKIYFDGIIKIVNEKKKTPQDKNPETSKIPAEPLNLRRTAT